jgi:tetratricopeptide (TPR) repeat protein
MSFSEQEILNKIQQAREAFSAGKFETAIDIYRELTGVLKDDEDNLPIIQIELGWSHYSNQNYSEAIEFLGQATQSAKLNDQQLFDCYRLIGFSAEMLGQSGKAIDNLKQAITIDIPETLKKYIYLELGKIYFTDGQILEAEHYLTKAKTLLKDEDKAYSDTLSYYLGFTLYFQKKFPEARKYFDQIIQSRADHKTRASGYFGLAHLHYHYKDYTALLDICEKIMRLDNAFYDKETLGFFLCEAYYHLKLWDNLEGFLKELQSQYPAGRYKSEYPRFETGLQQRGKDSKSSNPK